MKNNRTYFLRPEITKSHLNNRICQHCGVKTSTVTPSFYYVYNISLSCNNIPSFIGNLWWDLLLGNHLKQSLLVLLSWHTLFPLTEPPHQQCRRISAHGTNRFNDGAVKILQLISISYMPRRRGVEF